MRKIKRYWSVEGDIRVANKFSLSKHRDMWLWLSENPNRKKEDWIGWANSDFSDRVNHCFACGYTIRKCGEADCKFCPLDFGGISSNSATPCFAYQVACLASNMSKAEISARLGNMFVKEGILTV